MSDHITREELYSVIDRQTAYIEKIMNNGFQAITQRQDITNGRIIKLEDRVTNNEHTLAVLKDRANVETPSDKKKNTSNWMATGIAGVVVGAVEVIRQVLK